MSPRTTPRPRTYHNAMAPGEPRRGGLVQGPLLFQASASGRVGYRSALGVWTGGCGTSWPSRLCDLTGALSNLPFDFDNEEIS